ncbi:unnamed protein product [Acanthoscelides obtectus]|uniref:Uncharacterized protein n=1 Tax=Acanthoscelides obtectus TaxID=200917 RepID=A0A9P0VP06_ACAOB|nr:unnamed protein product [Acanthoscelides obtectus]CAK1640579.1 hypothetical protein AOBTE_LOCUS11815 [Acanthoscelides obtectus]
MDNAYAAEDCMTGKWYVTTTVLGGILRSWKMFGVFRIKKREIIRCLLVALGAGCVFVF